MLITTNVDVNVNDNDVNGNNGKAWGWNLTWLLWRKKWELGWPVGLGPEDGDHDGCRHFDDDFDEMPPRHQDLDITGQYCATLSHKFFDEFNDVKEDEDDCDYDNEDEDDDDGIDEVAPRHQAPQEHQGRLLP